MSSTTVKVPKKSDGLNVFEKLGNRFSYFVKRFTDGSFGTKLSHLIFGAGSFYHKQYVKGALFLLLQLAILAVMIFCPSVNGTPYGWKALVNLPLMNTTEGGFDPATMTTLLPSDCRLIVLFGFVTIALILIYILVWNLNVESSYKADNDRNLTVR